jgi:hypothetical protein
MSIVIEVSSPALLRLTFNLPALRNYFANPVKSCVSVKIDGCYTVFIKPVLHTGGLNTFELVRRGEHGRQILLEGDLANQMTEAFFASGDIATHPFFVIKPDKDGWLRLEHHTQEEAPKLVPHVRLWMSKIEIVEPRLRIASNDPTDIQSMLTDFVVYVSECRERVRVFETQRRAGRPPRNIMEAKFVITSFVSMARSISVPAQLLRGALNDK